MQLKRCSRSLELDNLIHFPSPLPLPEIQSIDKSHLLSPQTGLVEPCIISSAHRLYTDHILAINTSRELPSIQSSDHGYIYEHWSQYISAPSTSNDSYTTKSIQPICHRIRQKFQSRGPRCLHRLLHIDSKSHARLRYSVFLYELTRYIFARPESWS